MVNLGRASNRSISISKGIIFTFLLVYFIIFGMIITNFIDGLKKSSPETVPVFLSYIPLLCYIGAIFSGIYFLIFIKNISTHRIRESHSRKKIKGASTYKQAILLIVMIIVFIPILSPVIDNGENNQNFSVYNDEWNGASKLKTIIDDMGYDVLTVQSSLSATERLPDKNILLVILGPNQFYDPIFEIPYFINFFNESNSNSLLLAHDHGSTSTLLWEIFIANILGMIGKPTSDLFPVTLFPDGILHDNASYYPTPQFPIIKDFDSSHPTTSGISQVILSVSSSAAGGPLVEFFGWDIIGSASSVYSFVDKNGNGRVDPDIDVLDLSFIGDLLTSQLMGDGFPSEIFKLPLYSPFTPHVFLAKEFRNSRIFVSADASLFNNDLIDKEPYDNTQFAKNIIQWLTRNDPDDYYVVFDEAHIRPESSRDLTSAGIFGFIMQYIVHLSTNPITAWIYPVLALYSLKKYLPKKDKKKEEDKIAAEEEKKEEMARYRTSSLFAQKIEEYRDKMKYAAALKLLYRRLERKLNSQLGGKKITIENVIDLVVAKDPTTSKLKIRRLTRFMDKILSIKEGRYKVRTEQDFEELFFEMDWAANNL